MGAGAGMITVTSIKRSDYAPWLLERHYARRMCPVSHAFGAYADGELVGVVTYGAPASRHLCEGVCGPEWAGAVIELNRLCCEPWQNLASRLVGQSLRMLPRPAVVVSFADSAQGHVGYIYQATNWIYTGMTDAERKTPRKDWVLRGREGLHSRALTHIGNGAELRKRYGDDFIAVERKPKHRYIRFVGSKSQRRSMRDALRYPVEPYPKGETRRYDASAPVQTQGVLAL